MNIKPVPQRPPGMNDITYAEIMKRKRAAATRNGIAIGVIAIGFFIFPLAFTTWKNNQGTENMLVNKTMSLPGQKSTPIWQYEKETGESFSTLTQKESDAQKLGIKNKSLLAPQVDSTLTPQEQYQQYKSQKQQQKVE